MNEEQIRKMRDIPIDEVGCARCNKSINQIFIEHVEQELKDAYLEPKES